MEERGRRGNWLIPSFLSLELAHYTVLKETKLQGTSGGHLVQTPAESSLILMLDQVTHGLSGPVVSTHLTMFLGTSLPAASEKSTTTGPLLTMAPSCL